MRYITKEEIKPLLDFDELTKLTEEGFILFSQGKTLTPPFMNISIEEVKGDVHFKSGHILGDEFFTLKYSGGFWGNTVKNIPVDNGLFLVFSAKTGEPKAIISDIGYLTSYRTGIAGAIACKHLANKNSKVVTVIGTGEQAKFQVESLLQIMPMEKLKVWGRTPENVDSYIHYISSKYPKLIVKNYSNINEAIKDTDIIITTTYSDKPLIKSEWIQPGTHITAVGACEPQMQELDENIVKIADRVYADSIEMCMSNGEIHHAIKRKLIEEGDIIEIGKMLQNPKDYVRKPNDITVADLVGLGFQDAVIGSFVYKKATTNNVGIEI